MKLSFSSLLSSVIHLISVGILVAAGCWMAIQTFNLHSRLRCFELTRTVTSTTGSDKTWTVQETRSNQAAFDECLKLSR